MPRSSIKVNATKSYAWYRASLPFCLEPQRFQCRYFRDICQKSEHFNLRSKVKITTFELYLGIIELQSSVEQTLDVYAGPQLGVRDAILYFTVDVLHIIDLTLFPVTSRCRSSYGKLIVLLVSPCFAMSFDVLSSDGML